MINGESVSASAFVLAALRYNKDRGSYSLDILKNYYYLNSGRSGASVKMFCDTADDLAIFYKECCKLMSKHPTAVLIDQSPEFYRNCVKEFQKHNLSTSTIKYVEKNEIDERIKKGVNLLYKDQLHFYKECTEVIQDFRNAEYDTDTMLKSGKLTRTKIYTETGHSDSINAVEYGFIWFQRYL